MGNPFIIPMWIMLATGLLVSFLIDIPYDTLWGLTAYGPFLIVLAACLLWNRRASRD